MTCRAICFDLYETLITEFDPQWRPGPGIEARLGLGAATFAREWNQRRTPRMRGEIDFRTALTVICQAAGHDARQDIIQALYEERVALKSKPFRRVDAQILEMLSMLRKRNLPLALISNASAEEVTAWGTSALAPYFDVVVFSCDVGYVKPEMEIFHQACAQLQVSPAETLFVGDGGSDELTGAERAGLIPIWATWFLDQWPETPPRHAFMAAPARYHRVRQPRELIAAVVE